MDISQKVLAAFSEEHKDFLEGIRSTLTALQEDTAGADDPRFDEAYRMAHSLKGGARVCDLRPIETLGHRLETVFDRVRNGDLALTAEVTSKVTVVLDAIEDWMVALSEGRELTDPAEALGLIDHLLDLATQDERPSDRRQWNRHQKLLDAFQREYVGCVQQLRTQLQEIHQSGELRGTAQFSEMFRVVHSLHRAASVAGVTSVADLGSRLELLVSQLKIGTVEWHPEVGRCLAAAMDAVETEMTTSPELRPTAALREVVQSLQELIEGCCDVLPTKHVSRGQTVPSPALSTSQTTASVAVIPPIREMVRISTESLDGLLRSSGQLTTGVLGQNRMTTRLAEMASLVNDLDQARQAVRKALSADKTHNTSAYHFSRLARFLETTDCRIRDLARTTRKLQLLQKQSTWSLMRLAQEVQKDVRNARMVPVESLFQGFRKMVRDLARDEQKDIQFLTSGFDVLADRMVLQALKDPVMHLLRNAISHGAEPPDERQKQGKPATATLQLRFEAVGNRLTLTIADDGRGIALARVKETALKRRLISEAELAEKSDEDVAKLIFCPGLSTSPAVTELSGRGMGLSVVQEAVTRLQGEIHIRDMPGAETTIELSVPLAISTHRLLLVECAGQQFGIPLQGIRRLLRIRSADVATVAGRPVIDFDGQPVPLVRLDSILGIDGNSDSEGKTQFVAILKSGSIQLAVAVDRFIAETDSFLQQLTGPAARLTSFSGAILLEDGNPAAVLNVGSVIESAHRNQKRPSRESDITQEASTAPRSVLIVDDSFTTRTLEKSILEAHGYVVRVAVDGEEAITQLRAGAVDLVISDVEMPRMDGFALLKVIKADPQLSRIPVILVTSLDRREDQERGLHLGADAYIVKKKFDHEELITTIEQVI